MRVMRELRGDDERVMRGYPSVWVHFNGKKKGG